MRSTSTLVSFLDVLKLQLMPNRPPALGEQPFQNHFSRDRTALFRIITCSQLTNLRQKSKIVLEIDVKQKFLHSSFEIPVRKVVMNSHEYRQSGYLFHKI